MRLVAGWMAFGVGEMSDRPAGGVSSGVPSCAQGGMGAVVWGCKISDISDASGLMSDKLGMTVFEAS